MADYPNAKKNFTALIDGTTFMEAVNVNVVYDEVEATQLFIGASGALQSHNASILELLINQFNGLRVIYSGTDEITVEAGQAIIPNVTASVKKLRSNAAETVLTITNLDTGAMAEGFYYIYAVADASGSAIAFVFSASDSLPTGYTHYKKIGWFYNETASVLDVTSKFLGNIKDGNDNPNAIEVVGNTDITAPGSYADMTDMEIKFVSNGRPIRVDFTAPYEIGTLYVDTKIVINTVDKRTTVVGSNISGTSTFVAAFFWEGTLGAGEHTIKIQWQQSGATGKQNGNTEGERALSVKEL